MIGETTEVAKAVVKTGIEVVKTGVEAVKTGVKETGGNIKESARRARDFIDLGGNPDNTLKRLASIPTKKYETFLNRMTPPKVWRQDDKEKREKQKTQAVSKTQIGLINIG